MQESVRGLVFLQTLLYKAPDAMAYVTGNEDFPHLRGNVTFYHMPYGGVLIEAEFFGLPNETEPGATDFYGMHIHENGDCSLPFAKTGDHYNPTNEPHPMHYGDLISLFGNEGYAWGAFYDNRITVTEILERSVVVHRMSDDFKTQPSGNSGEKIGCGIIAQPECFM